MQKTHLRVEDARGNPLFDELLKTSLFFVIFITGVALGVVISFSLTTSFHLSAINPNQLVGAAAFFDPSTENTADVSALLPSSGTPSITLPTETPEVVVSSPEPGRAVTLSPSPSELRLLIVDKQIVIDRINQELLRVKSASVAFIAEFEQNCGSWSDVCAEPYNKALDENNTSYADLAAKLIIAQRSLIDAKVALEKASL